MDTHTLAHTSTRLGLADASMDPSTPQALDRSVEVDPLTAMMMAAEEEVPPPPPPPKTAPQSGTHAHTHRQ